MQGQRALKQARVRIRLLHNDTQQVAKRRALRGRFVIMNELLRISGVDLITSTLDRIYRAGILPQRVSAKRATGFVK